MTKELTNPTFDYSLVDKDTKNKLIYFEGQLSRSRNRVADELIKHGEILHGAQQELANYSSGIFLAWLNSVGVSKSAAYRAIEVYTEFGGFSQLGNLEVSALYDLAKNPGAKKKALRLADRGVKVTHSMAKKLIEEESQNNSPGGAAPAGVTDDPEPEFSSGEDDELDTEEPEESAPAPPRKGRAKRGGKPQKQFDGEAYYKQWHNALGPVIRLVSAIARARGESNTEPHEKVRQILRTATDEMKKWMGVKE